MRRLFSSRSRTNGGLMILLFLACLYMTIYLSRTSSTQQQNININLFHDRDSVRTPAPLNQNDLSLNEDDISHFPIQLPTIDDCSPPKFDGNCRPLGFNSGPIPLTALASYPGSGNTWMRHIIEQITGIYTGSIYNDKSLQTFKGEGITNSSVVVVKTHRSPRNSLDDFTVSFDKAIVILRDLANAMVSEFVRHFSKSHNKEIKDLDGFFNEHERDLWTFTILQPDRWQKLYKLWLHDFKGDVLLVKYEDLVEDLRPQLLRIVKFLDIDVTDDVIDCVVCNSDGRFRRKHSNKTFTPFSIGRRKNLNFFITHINKKLPEYCNKSNVQCSGSLHYPHYSIT
ncbi:unnamed protein product [Owenia fusiformis]|uniref:Uncharacterized protein n=1 Tax=Owenia fusiformis TaxID=6347 RepID=A0A8J1TYR6_OWEFU|nr:unnamed protein product [Owenia fusiformis]